MDRVIPTHVSNTDPATIEGQAARQPFNEENVRDRKGLGKASRSIDRIISFDFLAKERERERVVKKVGDNQEGVKKECIWKPSRRGVFFFCSVCRVFLSFSFFFFSLEFFLNRLIVFFENIFFTSFFLLGFCVGTRLFYFQSLHCDIHRELPSSEVATEYTEDKEQFSITHRVFRNITQSHVLE